MVDKAFLEGLASGTLTPMQRFGTALLNAGTDGRFLPQAMQSAQAMQQMQLEQKNQDRRFGLLSRQQKFKEEQAQAQRRQQMRERQALGDLASALGQQPSVVGAMGPVTPDMAQRDLAKQQQQAIMGALSAGIDPKSLAQIQDLYIPPDIRTFQHLQSLPEEQRREFGEAFRTGTTVNMGDSFNPREKKFLESAGTRQSNFYEKIQTEALSSLNQQAQLDQMSALLDAGLKTGFGQDFALQLSKAGQALGFDIGDQAPLQESLNAISNQLALTLRNPDSGMGLPGATSENDLKFLKSLVASAGDTPQGIRLKIAMSNAINERKMDIYEYADSIVDPETGLPPNNFAKQVASYARENLPIKNYIPEDLLNSTKQQESPQQQFQGFEYLGVE